MKGAHIGWPKVPAGCYSEVVFLSPPDMNFAEQLKSQLNIVDVVSQYVRLKRQGSTSRYVGLCPFHSEKTPSFGVNSALGYYKCFGCDAHGDVFNFVQQIESLTFSETLKSLAERYGIPMPRRERPDDPEAQLREGLLEMHEIAASLFQQNLRGPNGAKARQYLESRGVSAALADEFRLGLSDDGWQQLSQKLSRFSSAWLEQSGLVARKDGGSFFDRFRGRLMFPIHNESGQVIGFGARALREEDQPKYLNSPETKIYKKSMVLYNLHRAKIDARKNDRMILVEGYMDVIGVYASGVHEVVASSGTSLDSGQVRAIKRQIAHQQSSSGTIYLNFDSDGAGLKSTEKYIGLLLSEGVRVKVLEIPGQLDPDEYIQQQGPDAYRSLMERATSYFHWLADRTRSKFDMRTPEGRVDAFKQILPVVQQISDRVERAAIRSELAEYLAIDRETLNAQLKSSPAAEQTQRAPDILASVPPNEKLLLACLITSDNARAAILQYLRQTDTARLLQLREIFENALKLDAAGDVFSVQTMMERLNPRMQKVLVEIGFSDWEFQDEGAVQQALNCLTALGITSSAAQCDELRRRIRELEQGGNYQEALRLADELDNVKRATLGA